MHTWKISNYVTGSHGTQSSLVIALERWKQAIDKGEYISPDVYGSLQGF